MWIARTAMVARGRAVVSDHPTRTEEEGSARPFEYVTQWAAVITWVGLTRVPVQAEPPACT
jgi:hypothetical protein